MKISHCRLLKKTQSRLLEYFVLEVTVRSAADILGIQPNSAALFYRKIREVIVYHLGVCRIGGSVKQVLRKNFNCVSLKLFQYI